MKLLRDTWLVYQRQMLLTVRQPVWLFVGITTPFFYLVLFGPILDAASKAPGFPGGGTYNVFVPGLLVQLGLFGSAFVGFALIAELRNGVIERMRVTPVSRLALLLGRSARDVTALWVQGVILVLIALPFGLRIDPPEMVVMLGLLALLGMLGSSCSYALGLVLRSEDALAPLLNFFVIPMTLLSGVLLPLSLAPGWLRALGTANPVSHAVDASRALFHGNLDGDVLRGLLVVGALCVVTVTWAARRFASAVA